MNKRADDSQSHRWLCACVALAPVLFSSLYATSYWSLHGNRVQSTDGVRCMQSFGIIKMNVKWGFSLINNAIRREWMRWHCSLFDLRLKAAPMVMTTTNYFYLLCLRANVSAFPHSNVYFAWLVWVSIASTCVFGCDLIGISLHVYPPGDCLLRLHTKTRIMQKCTEPFITD